MLLPLAMALHDHSATRSAAAAAAPEPFAAALPAGTASRSCRPTASVACLLDGRFGVKASWSTGSGAVQAVRGLLAVDHVGLFQAPDAAGAELLVKMLDACSASEAPGFWLFALATASRHVTLHVTDARTGRVRRYTSWAGTERSVIVDVDSFAACLD